MVRQESGRKRTVRTDRILDNIDVLADGRFAQALKNLPLQFRGSSDQRIIDLRRTRKGNDPLAPVLWDPMEGLL